MSVIKINKKFDDMITGMAFDESVIKDELIKSVFVTYEFLKREMRKKKARIGLFDSNNQMITEFVMPWEERG